MGNGEQPQAGQDMEQKQGQRQNVDGQPKSLVLDFLPCKPGLVVPPQDDQQGGRAVYQHVHMVGQLQGPRKKGGGDRHDDQYLAYGIARDDRMILFHKQPSLIWIFAL